MTDYNHTRGMISPSTCKADQRHNRRVVRDADFRNACPSGNWIACGSRKHNHTVALLRETSAPNDLNKTINTRSGLMTYNMTPRNPEGRRSTVLATRHARRHLPSNPTNRYLPRQRLRKPAYWPRTHFIWTDNWPWALSWWWSTPIEKLRWGLR